MIGQTFTEQSHVLIQKTCDRLDILHHDNVITEVSKIKLHCLNESTVSGLTVTEVYTNPKFTGALYIEGGLQNRDGSCHYIPVGIYHFDETGRGNIAINGMKSEPFNLTKDVLIARGNIAREETENSLRSVSTIAP